MCGMDRTKGIGICGMTDQMVLARAALHFWEEPCISAESGSGAVFFVGCPMHCAFCQNQSIANAENKGFSVVSTERLVQIFFELKEQGANNINLVTADHFIPSVTAAIKMAKEKGFGLPFIYNTSGYVNVESLKMLEGLIDVYLPDFKYWDSSLAKDLSKCPDYPAVVKKAITEMVRQVGQPVFYKKNKNKECYTAAEYNEFEENDFENAEILIKRGVIVRHLILPEHTNDSKEIISYLLDEYGNKIYISIMNQYTPVISKEMAEKIGHSELLKRVIDAEYEGVIDYAIERGIENGFIQDGETNMESFIPEFDGTGIR
ncbi:MAG: radical SAM protein [Lachnospiraceae bacterium]|nr:radical SAM protein [Lachnospiraceae bacterium]